MALIGTTVVPYNLFLHARGVREKWAADEPIHRALNEARWDTALSILLGGAITISVLMTATLTLHLAGEPLVDLPQIAHQLAPVAGGSARALFAVGLFAAGLTSAVTAPLAAAVATSGCLGWSGDWREWRFRGVALAVVAAGVLVAVVGGGSPRSVILFAQAANGLLLPVVVVFLLLMMNRRDSLGVHVNGRLANLLGIAVVCLVMALVARNLFVSLS